MNQNFSGAWMSASLVVRTAACRADPLCVLADPVEFVSPDLRAAPLVRAKAKFTVKNADAANGRLGHTAFFTVIFTFARTSGADLTLACIRI